jgi:hypothetical protein
MAKLSAKLLAIGRSTRAPLAGALVLLLLLQSLAVAGAGRALAPGAGVAVGPAAAEIVCHSPQDGAERPGPAAPRSHAHCALCPCLSAGPALDAALIVAILLSAPPPAAATPRAGPGEVSLPPAGRAGAWSSRAPPLG